MTNQKVRVIGGATLFGGLLGLVAVGVWAVDQPADSVGDMYVIADSTTDPEMLSPPTSTFTGSTFIDLAPAPGRRLPIPLWLALPSSEGDPFGGPVAMRLGVGGSWSTVGRTRSG